MNDRNDLQAFVERISSIYDADHSFSIISARKIVREINDFLYTTYEGIGSVKALGNEYQFFSEFHRYWNANYAEILNVKICDEKCALVADASARGRPPWRPQRSTSIWACPKTSTGTIAPVFTGTSP